MDFAETQRWADRFLDERTPLPDRPAAAAAATLGQERAAAPADAPPTIGFSPFVPADAVRARELSGRLMAAAAQARAADGDATGFAAARALANHLLADHDPALVRFALKLFMTHDVEGQRLRIRALEGRAPLKVVPSGPPPLRPIGAEATGAQEAALNWWREDPELNEHHDHWHVVYPTSGIADPRPGDPFHTRLQDRQGELFIYMHEQMLARYDHERIALGLGAVKPLDDYAAPVLEGYDPAAGLAGFPAALWIDGQQPTARPDGATMPPSVTFPDGDVVRRADLQTWRGRLEQAATTGRMVSMKANVQMDTTIDALGHAVEPSTAPTDPAQRPTTPDPGVYQWLHGAGHVLLSVAAGAPQGVMADTDTAVRDPVFYRWHRHIDNLAHDWQETQPSHDLAAHAAAVELRHGARRPTPNRPAESGDLILFDEADVGAGLDDAAFAAAVEQAAGGARWDDDLAATRPGTSELKTEMLWRPLIIDPPIPGTPAVRIPYLDQRPFAYALRLRNTDPAGAAHDVTIRLFLVADVMFDQRRNWIELDKFRFHVSGERSVAVRRARESAVIRKPASKPPGPTTHSPPPPDHDDPPPGWDAESYCDCGWPYNLLIPRGTGDGMRCWLAAIVTDWTEDQVTGSTCGSMSYCGAKDQYPDRRPMGYPFDRPISAGQIADVLSTLPSAAARSFTIRWLNPGFPN